MCLRIFWLLLGISFSVFVAACGPNAEERMREARAKSAVTVDLPRSIQNGVEADLKGDMSRVVSLVNDRYYVGASEYPLDVLRDKVKDTLAAAPTAPIYLQAGYTEEYGDIAKVLDTIRSADGSRVALLVSSDAKGPHCLHIALSAEPKEDSTPEKDSLEVVSGKDGKLTVKGKDAGTRDDPSKLADAIRAAPGQPVKIKPRRDSRYVDVVRLVDAAKGAGADPIVLTIDDLE